MDEGRPTKAKWWSRPRQESPGTTHQPPPTEPEHPATGHTGAFGQGQPPERPVAPRPGAVQAGQGPAVPAQGTPATGTEQSATGHTGAFAQGQPLEQSATGHTGAFAQGQPLERPVAPRPGAVQAGQGPAVPARGTGPDTVQPAGAASSTQVERPRPLHDPDPYSTPPYGEPGPWAPAPPVQHPAATPAHGTTLPATPQNGTPPHGTQGPASMHGGTPPHGTPDLTPAPGATPPHGTQGPASMHGGTPPHGTPDLTPAPGATPPHGTQGPAPMHGTTPPPLGAAAPTPTPYGGAPHGQAPAPHAPAPHGQAPAPHPQASAPRAGQPQAGQPQAVQGAGHRQPYDPWNQPLQQIGSLPPETREKQRKRAKRLVVVGVVLIALVSGLIGGALGSYLERNGVGEVELPQVGSESADRPKGSVAGIAAAALPGVVTLHVSGDSAQGTGTGFVLDRKGHILTNNHVVEPAGTGGEISVTFSGGESAEAKMIGRDSGYDLAVVKVTDVRGLKPLTLGNSENVQVGDPVVAIGAPFDLANTVTSGIISAKERPITAGGEKGDGSDVSYVDALQTDAPINPGNSGGPLVDSKARVIGINSAIRSAGDGSDMKGGQAGSIGLGFAIPINQGKRVAEELINFGKATHPVIGVTLDTQFSGDGARIADKGKNGGPAVNADGPGDKAGLKPGDIITEVDGAPVHSSDELIVKVRAHRPKDRLDLTIERDGRDREVTLVLGSADGD
ncbi:trypsin-like peptidase domain-containing protein [Streptomyces sp. G5(2025)]|uniref:S1C family serine protease n=1 Tax=Streptomyces sp. G5(2025) TaxID=3406628 RepID=UPI003C1CDAC6